MAKAEEEEAVVEPEFLLKVFLFHQIKEIVEEVAVAVVAATLGTFGLSLSRLVFHSLFR